MLRQPDRVETDLLRKDRLLHHFMEKVVWVPAPGPIGRRVVNERKVVNLHGSAPPFCSIRCPLAPELFARQLGPFGHRLELCPSHRWGTRSRSPLVPKPSSVPAVTCPRPTMLAWRVSLPSTSSAAYPPRLPWR